MVDTLRFNNFLHNVADTGLELLRGRLRSSKGRGKSLRILSHELLSTQGEASAIAIARDIVDRYRNINDTERIRFFQSICDDFDVDHDAVLAAAKEYCDSQNRAALRELTKSVESKRQDLFRGINMAPGGTGTIVEMRRDMLQTLGQHPQFEAIEFDLKHLLSSWFNRGFLILERIDWETPAIILEKLIEYETVHEMKGWGDLRGRLADDRRCFAFFHPTLPNDPLIFVEVALVKNLAQSIDPIIAANRSITNPHHSDTAIFYSINNCQEGLRGISFGNLLIKQVVQQLAQEFPNLKNFATLSPIPGFGRWFRSTLENSDGIPLSAKERKLMLATQTDSWFDDESLLESLKPTLVKLAAIYLSHARRRDEPLDPVARFHLRNGASLERINWLADCSPNGIKQSFGMLVNYIYDPEKIVQNHENYVSDRKLAISKDILELVPQQLRPDKSKKKLKRNKVAKVTN